MQTCHSALITLLSYPSVIKSSYQILLSYKDTNTTYFGKDGIYIDGAISKSPGILNCDTTHYFWLTWKGGIISIGSGLTPGVSTILSYDDSQHDPYSINVMGVTNNHNWAKWTFGNIDGEMSIMSTICIVLLCCVIETVHYKIDNIM